MKKKIIIALVFSVALIGLILVYQQFRYQYLISTPADPNDNTEVTFVIKDWRKVADDLFEKNLILDSDAFLQYAKKEGFDRKIKAGVFYLKKSMTIPEIMEAITSNESVQISVTIPEGYTIADIDKKLTDLGVISSGNFITTAQILAKKADLYQKYPFLDQEKNKILPTPFEGFLFPDTYFIDRNDFKSEDLIELMLSNFQKKIRGFDVNSSDRTIFEIVTMASIVEKEARNPKDLPIVSGILWKRLDVGMQLGADATLLYLKSDKTIDYQDLQKDSPYNTRKKLGLPPGPICNPGLKALEAALRPEETPYFYYLSKPDNGEMVYSKTNEEHNQNKARYLN